MNETLALGMLVILGVFVVVLLLLGVGMFLNGIWEGFDPLQLIAGLLFFGSGVGAAILFVGLLQQAGFA